MPHHWKTIAISLLAGFAAPASRAATVQPPSPVHAPTRVASVVQLLPACPSETARWRDPQAHSPEAAALAAALAPLAGAAAEGVVSWSINWFVDREKQLTASRTAHANSTMYRTVARTTLRNRCLVYLRGEVGDDATFEGRVTGKSLGQDALWTPDRLRMLRDGVANEVTDDTVADVGRIAVVAKPLVYAEFDIDPDKVAAAHYFSMKPHLLDYRASAAERTTSGTKDVVFLVRFERAATRQAIAEFSFAYPDLQVGSTYGVDALDGTDSALARLPSQSDGEPNEASADPVPMTVSVTMAESEKVGDVELGAEQALAAERDKLSKAAGETVRKALH